MSVLGLCMLTVIIDCRFAKGSLPAREWDWLKACIV